MTLKLSTGRNGIDTSGAGVDPLSLIHKATLFELCSRSLCGLALAVCLFAGLTSRLAGAEPEARNRPSEGRRYLLIVETSKAMAPRVAGVRQAVRDLLGTGLHGELRAGDTLGVWTFNESLFTGQYPLQHYSKDQEPIMAGGVANFLKGQRFEGRAEWSAVMPALAHLVKGSRWLTVLLVTSGTEDIQGTPFDSSINQSFHTWRDPQQTARMPLVTVLRAHEGTFTASAVSAVPWPVELPRLPIERPVAATASPAVKTQAAKTVVAQKPPPMAPPLIVVGKKPTPAPVAAPVILSESNRQPAPVLTAASAAPPTPGAAPAESQALAQSAVAPTVVNPVDTSPSKTYEEPARMKAEPVMPRASEPIASSSQPEPAAASAAALHPDPGAPGEVKPEPVSNVLEATAAPAVAHGKLLWLSSGAAAVLAVVSLLLLWKRSRPPEHVSLITRSLERQHGRNANR